MNSSNEIIELSSDDETLHLGAPPRHRQINTIPRRNAEMRIQNSLHINRDYLRSLDHYAIEYNRSRENTKSKILSLTRELRRIRDDAAQSLVRARSPELPYRTTPTVTIQKMKVFNAAPTVFKKIVDESTNEIYNGNSSFILKDAKRWDVLETCCFCFREMFAVASKTNHLQVTNCGHFTCKKCIEKFIVTWEQTFDLLCPCCRKVLLLKK
jgi:hypothetical protein